MTNQELILELKKEYGSALSSHQQKLDYYTGKHDILNQAGDKNNVTISNYIENFINTEVSYVLGNPLTYTSRNGNDEVIKTLNNSLYHWDKTHDQELLRQSEIFGECYELMYINSSCEFCARIFNPTNSIVYCNSDNEPSIFIHFYRKRFDKADYYDAYYANRIETYKDDVLIGTEPNLLKRVPISICKINDEQVIYNKIKTLNDAYNRLLSDQQSIISSYKNAYLVVQGVSVEEADGEQLKKSGIINLKNKDAKVEWLIKNLNDTFIKNQVECIKTEMFEIAGHVPTTEKLQSNLSGVALRSRLIALEQRCSLLSDCVTNTIIKRIKFLFEYIAFKSNKKYDYKDIAICFTPNIPQDLVSVAQVINQLGDKISNETALTLLPFISNPSLELAKIKAEQEQMVSIELDKMGLSDE